LLAFLPAALIGALFIGPIKHLFCNPEVVAMALIVGGLIILWVEGRDTVPHDRLIARGLTANCIS
jgi:undecaprenyl-diphosphatase